MKNGIYFIVIALLVVELFKILIYANEMTSDVTLWTQNDIKITKKWNISEDFFCIELKLCTVVTLITKFHDMSTVTFPWQHNGLQALSIQKVKSEFSSFKKCYLLLVFIQQVWANMDITQHKHKKVRSFFILGR